MTTALWIYALVAGYTVYESVVIGLYKLVKADPQWAVGVVLGSKVVKMLLTAGLILGVRYATDLPLRRFALTCVAIYAVSVVVETAYILLYGKKSQQHNEHAN